MVASQLRSAGWVRTGYGAALIFYPGAVLGLVNGPTAPTGRAIVRVLGLREAGQALVCAPRPTSDVLKVGAVVDLVHAATMLALAARSTTWRRPALASAAIAASYAVITSHDAKRLPRVPDGPLQLTARTHATVLDRLLDLRDRTARTVVRW